MVQKYFFIVLIVMGIGVVSCRQDDELNTQNASTDLLIKKKSTDENYNSAKTDSTEVGLIPNDPPKNGTHWKTGDSLYLFDEIKDPPKNGTHWKSGN